MIDCQVLRYFRVEDGEGIAVMMEEMVGDGLGTGIIGPVRLLEEVLARGHGHARQ